MNRKRESKGIPTGGRFATENRSEVDIDLGESFPDALGGAKDFYADRHAPVSDQLERNLAQDTSLFIETNRELIDSVIDDADDTGYMLGRDFAAARTYHDRDVSTFMWVADPKAAAALRSSARSFGALRVGAGKTTREEAQDPGTGPGRLDEIAQTGEYWEKVAVAKNPSTTVGTLKKLRASEAEDDFLIAFAENPNTPPEILAVQADHWSSYVRPLTVAHPNANREVIDIALAASERELARSIEENRTAYGPMKSHSEAMVRYDRKALEKVRAAAAAL